MRILVALALVAAVAGQASSPVFDAVSIKPSGGGGVVPPSAPDRYYRASTILTSLIADAYGYPRSRIANVPDWNDGTTFEVSARASSPMSADVQKVLVQQMLADRFALRTHVEPREMSYYALSLGNPGRLGARLSKTTHDCAAIRDARARAGETGPGIPRTPGSEMPVCSTFIYARQLPDGQRSLRYMSSGMTMGAFAAFLSGPASRPVIDRTGLDGEFDLDTEFATLQSAASDDRPALATALDEQLGLKLQSQRGPIDVLVIDAVSTPTPN